MLSRALEISDACAGCTGRPLKQRTYARGDVLCVEGMPARFVFSLVEGWARESRVLEDGRLQALRLLRPGDLAGIEGLTGDTYETTVEVLREARVCLTDTADVRRGLVAHPERGAALSRALLEDLRRLRTQVLALGAMTAEERVRQLLGELLRGTPQADFVALPVTRREIAELLGLTQETVSRTIQRLVRDGVLETEGRRLRRAAGSTL